MPATYNTVSSPYLLMCGFLRTSTISFAKIVNNKEPKMDPCETSQVNNPDSDKVLL